MPDSPTSDRILVFGATGYTGELTARALVERGARPLLIARNSERVTALAHELGGLDSAVADAGDPAALAELVNPGDVLISTVGPFLRFGEPAVQVAAEKGAHYLDSTGEGPFIQRVFEHWGPIAARKDAGLLSAFGFDFVPGSLAGALALERAGENATRLDVGYFVTGFGTSGGTQASLAGMMLEDGFAYIDGTVQTARTGRRIETFDVSGRPLTAVSIPGGEHFALPASYPQLRDLDVFLGAPPALARGLAASALFATPARQIQPLKALSLAAAGFLIKGSTGGPSAEQRAASSSTVVANAHSASGDLLASVTLGGPDPYDFTASALAWGAITVAQGGLRATGGLGPVAAFGLDALTAGCTSIGLVEQ
jgi:short subunit dehydrogenase-like uncharacterized protein